MVMAKDSCYKCHGFESQHRILDGHFSYLFVLKIVILLGKTKINEKVGRDGPFFIIKSCLLCFNQKDLKIICQPYGQR